VNRRHGRGAVADRKGDTLGAAATTITGGEHTGQACFNRAWRPGFFPNGEKGDVLAGQHETLVISYDGRWEEVGSGLCSDENEEARSKFLLYRPARVAHMYTADMIDALNSDDFGVVADSDSLVR